MADNILKYQFRDKQGNKHTVWKSDYDADPKGFAEAYPDARFEVVNRKTGDRGHVAVKDVAAAQKEGFNLWTIKAYQKEHYDKQKKPQTAAQMAMSMGKKQPQTDYLSRPQSQQSKTTKAVPKNVSPFVRGLYQADNYEREQATRTDYTDKNALKNLADNKRVGRNTESNFAVNHIVHDEEARRNQPIVKTETPADDYIVKTQGQLENEMQKSGANLVNSEKGDNDFINSVINQELFTESNKRARQALGEVKGFNMETAEMDELRRLGRANAEFDPAKMIKDLEKVVQTRAKEWLGKPETKKRIQEEASKLGVSVDDYIKNSVSPALYNKIAERLPAEDLKRYLPKNRFEYIIGGIGDSAIGTLASMDTTSKEQRQLRQQVAGMTDEGKNPYFNPGMWDKVGRGTVSFVADAPLYSAAGVGAGAAVEKVFGNAAMQAARVANMNVASRVLTGVGKGALHGGVTGFQYGAANAVVQNYSTGEDTSLGNTLKQAALGGISEATSFATMEGMGGVVGGLGHKIGFNGTEKGWKQVAGKTAKKLTFEAVKTGMEGIGMATGGVASSYARHLMTGEDWKGFTVEGTLESCANAVAFKLMHAKDLLKRSVDPKTGKSLGIGSSLSMKAANFLLSDATKMQSHVFTDEEKHQLFNAGASMGVSPVKNIFDLAKKAKSTNPADVERAEDGSDVLTYYQQIMNDPTVSWDAKAKFSTFVMGTMPESRPMYDHYAVGTEEGTDKDNSIHTYNVINEYAADGTLLSKHRYDTRDKRESIVYELSMKREDNRLQNAIALVAHNDKNNYELQNQFFMESMKNPKADAGSLVTAMGDEGSDVFRDFNSFVMNAENGKVMQTFDAIAKQNGMDRKDLIKAANKDSMKRTDAEQNACIQLRQALEDVAFPKDKVHEEQSHLQGKDVAEDNALGSEHPNGEAVKAELKNLNEAEKELDQFIESNDVFGQNFKKLQEQGMTNPQIYQWMVENGGLTEEHLAPFAHYINANARVQGMQNATQQKIEERVSSHVADWSHRGTFNGQKSNGEQVVYVQDKDGRMLVVGSGDMAFDSTTGRAKEGVGDMLVCLDPNRNEMVYVKAEDVTLFQTQKPEDFGNEYRQKLQQINSTPYNQAAQQQAAEDAAKAQQESGEGAGQAEGKQEGEPSEKQEVKDGQEEKLKQETPVTEGENAEKPVAQQEEPKEEPMKFKDGTNVPMKKDSKGRPTPDYEQMTAEQSAEIMANQFGEDAAKVADARIKKAEKAVKDAEKMKVDYSADDADIIEQKTIKEATISAAKEQLQKAEDVKKALTAQKVKETLETKKTEEPASGNGEANTASSGVAAKFQNAPRLQGRARTRTLHDGTKVSGHYEIVPAESLTPSHDVFNGYKKSEGFPVDAEGRTINDRDYEHDTKAQDDTNLAAAKYDGQAIDHIPTVSDEGIVYDGNGRTMAGQKAAKDGTDGEYIKALYDNAEMYGFTKEQIEQSGIEHPRLVLVTDERLPYDTTTFAKFNQNERKTQSNAEKAVVKAKTLTSDEIGSIVAEVEGVGSLEAFFKNPKAINDLIKTLQEKGILAHNEIAELLEGEGNLSAQGKEYVKNLLLGSVFTPETIRMMGIDSAIKTKAVAGIRAIMDNMKLGDYSLRDEIDNAVKLLYEARNNGMTVDDLLRQSSVFDEDARKRFSPIEQALAQSLEGQGTMVFRDLLREYNDIAKNHTTGEGDMFGGNLSPEELVKQFLEVSKAIKNNNIKLYGNETERRNSEQEGGVHAASNEESAEEARGAAGTEGNEPTESQQQVDEAVKSIATEITKGTGLEVVTDDKVGQSALEDAEATDSNIKFHKETDQDILDELNNGETIKVYRAMQVIDGKLYPPMAASVGGKLVEANELGVWIRADENPDLAIPDIDPKTGKQKVDKKTGELKWKFKLDKGGKDATGKKATDVNAAYNPYWHMSRSPLNDQFKSAWIRPNIVVVECEVPVSELSSGYKAERAKDAVGEVDWKSGSVSGEVFKQTGRARKVILSRWCKPVRVLDDAEVAQRAKEFVGEAKVEIPENVLTPKQRIAFEEAGFKIGAPEKGVNKSEQIAEAIEKGLQVDNRVKLSKKEKDDAIKRIDERIAELHRLDEKQSLKSENGNLAESHSGNGYLPDENESAGAQSVASSDAKVNKKFPTKGLYLHNLANFITGLRDREDVTANNFVKTLFEGLGMTPHGKEQKSEYVRFTSDDGEKMTIRLSDHSGNAISIIKKGGRADKGFSIVIKVDGSPETKFKDNKYADVTEYVYENPNMERLENISKTVFNLIDKGEYVDLADADKVYPTDKKAKQFRSKDGEVYGFTDGEKIYLDTKKMKPETPLHEYTHLWTEALKRGNQKEWENVKKLFDEVEGLKEEVQKLYPELKGDDLYEEMITTYSGREGAKKLEEVVRELAVKEGKTVTESAKAQGFLDKVKTALQKYWKGVADMLHIHFTTAEEVADKVLADWAKGVNPRDVRREEIPGANEMVEKISSLARDWKSALESGDKAKAEAIEKKIEKAMPTLTDDALFYIADNIPYSIKDFKKNKDKVGIEIIEKTVSMAKAELEKRKAENGDLFPLQDRAHSLLNEIRAGKIKKDRAWEILLESERIIDDINGTPYYQNNRQVTKEHPVGVILDEAKDLLDKAARGYQYTEEDKFERKLDDFFSDPMEALTNAAEAHREGKLDAARTAFAEAKKSGDESEIKRTRDELKQQLDEKYKAQHMDLVQRHKEIAKEIGKAEAEKIDKPWVEMDGEERMFTAEKNPLTEDEIRNNVSEENQDLIEDAIDYLNGNHGFAQQLAYLKIYEDVRRGHENAAGDSRAEDGTQLAPSDNGGSEGLELGTGRESRGTSGQLDRGTGGETAPELQPSGENSEGQLDTPVGERGNSEGEGDASRLGGLSAGDTKPKGSGNDDSDGTALRHDKGRRGSNRPSKTNARRKPAAKQGTTWRNRTEAEIKQEAKDAKAGLKAALAEMMKRGRGEASLSLVGLNSKQIEYVPELMKAVKRYGMSLIDQGIYKIKDWMSNIREGVYDDMKAIGFSDKDIDDFIEEMWNSKMTMDGETHTISEWSSIYGNAQLRKKLGDELEAKRQKQMDAEPIKVKIGDRKNIEETLPFLLPQQQEDVLKAETQFFGNEHADRAHAYGKGYMFTNGTGTGKTYTGLGIAKRLAKQGKGRILFITPSQPKVKDWIKDGKNLGLEIHDLDAVAKDKGTTATTESGEGMVITTYANMRQNKKLLETEWDAVIYDESHRIMENKKGAETTGSQQHYMLTNRNENYTFLRLQTTNKDYQKMQSAADKFNAEREKECKRIEKEYKQTHPEATDKDVTLATAKQKPKNIRDFAPADASTFPKLGKVYQDYTKASSHYYKDVEPKLKEQAKQSWKNTKTVFLSATPFNTRENLDYAEGYIFKYPEDNPNDRISPRSRFYMDHFGAAYRFRYNRLEAKKDNPDAIAKQEVAFSDYLQNTLGTMSGRIIDSAYDYSRDFPTVAPDHAEDFNNATQDAMHGRYLSEAYHKTIGDYNYGSALFETMKIANIIDRMKEHIAAGRKIVVFHRRVETKEPLQAPFAYMLNYANELIKEMRPGKEREEAIAEANEFRRKYADLLQWEQTLDYSMPREQIAKAFGNDNVLFFSGKETPKAKTNAVKIFNDDNSGKNIIVIQEASGKEGISLHDTTGEHQRVCITLALPQSPITALQIEGRTYRIGNKSNAIFEYPILGLNSEMMLFGEKFNSDVSTTENLALGSQARSLRESFANGVLEHSGIVPIDQQGVGGKEYDAPKGQSEDPYGDAILDYYSNQKLNKRNREGVDYFPTPEPLGYKMVEWANMGEGDTALEPSAGHGAIARYVPKENQLLSIEPSQSLFTKLQLKAGGLGRKFLNTTFENYDVSNKHDVVVMNPPFGTAGATAIAHIDKAFKHLDEGGRVVAIIPRGSTDKKFDKWIDGQKNVAMRAEVALPDIVFQQAGTRVSCRVVVLDKITDAAMRAKAGYPEKVDLSGHYDKIEDFFEDLRDVEMPDRIIDTQLKDMKKARTFKKDLESIKGINVSIEKRGISVFDKNRYNNYGIAFPGGNMSKEWLTDHYSKLYQEFSAEQDRAYNENSKAALDEMKKLTCKLADMSEDEMRKYIEDKKNGGTHFREETDVPSVKISDKAPEVVKHIASVAQKVGGKVNMVHSVDEIANQKAKAAIEEGKPVTGWYDEKTGEVHLYMPNIHDRYTAEKTIWHETVGHKGMRELFGEDKFDKFLDSVWYDLDKPENVKLKELVMDELKQNPFDYRNAIEEGIARLAEEGKGEPGFWNNIKNKVTDFLHELGYRMSPNTKDVKYLLWLSKNLQKHPNDPYFKLKSEAVKHRLDREDVPALVSRDGVFHLNDGKEHSFMDMPKAEYQEATDGKIHFRTTPSAATAMDRYSRALNAHGYMATESYMDNMLSLKELMKAVDTSAKRIEDIKSSENPYILQNTMQGAMSVASQKFEHDCMVPLNKAMANVLDAFDGKKTNEKIRNFNLYMITKHGLERNRVLFVRDYIRGLEKADADTLQKQWNAEKQDLGERLRNGSIDLNDYYKEMDEWICNNVDKDFKAEEHDYSGMHGLQEIEDEDQPYDDAAAIQSVMDSEARMESAKSGSVKDLWSKIHAATSFGLYTDYANGFQSRETYTKTAQMFDWYVPLRKFDEDTAEDVYGYVTEKGDPSSYLGSVLMGAKGRKSLSETNILAQIGVMGNTAIRNGGRNAIKQAFMRFARSHNSEGLITEGQVWLVKDGTNADGSDRWVEAYPEIPEGAAPKTVSTTIAKFEAKMAAKQATGDAKVMRNAAEIGYKFQRAADKSQHVVDVKVNGKTHRFYINGNPRAAQALNGMLENKGSKYLKPVTAVTRMMAQLCTSYSPEFVVRNIVRDAEFALSNVTSKEGVAYAGRFSKYYAMMLPVGAKNVSLSDLKGTEGLGLYAKYRNGKLDMNNKVHRYFKEFMDNGGETGWVQVLSMKEWEKKYKRNIKTELSKGSKGAKAASDFIFGNLKNLNEAAENMARFATYCTSRDSGRSVIRSTYDAKEVSTNFNRHGSGDAIWSFKNGEMGDFKKARRNVYGFFSSYLRQCSMFFNAGIQSTNLLKNNLKNAPKGTIAAMMSTPFIMGFGAALLNNWMIAQEDEKERGGVKDPYGEMPDYIRRNNLCIYKGGGEFITIPLAIELRAFYGLGDLAVGKTFAGNVESTRPAWADAVGCVSQLVPVMDYTNSHAVDKNPVTETVKALSPSAASPFLEWGLNSDWKGAPIRRETTSYNEYAPAWQRAYKNTPEVFMNLNKKANAATNDIAPGNEDMLGWGWLDALTNPAADNHFLGSFGGGAATFTTRMVKMGMQLYEGKTPETGDIPFLRSFLYKPNEQSSMQRTKSKWYNYVESMEKTMSNLSRLKSKNVPIDKRLENIGAYYKISNSKEAEAARIIEQAQKYMTRWNKMKAKSSDAAAIENANQNVDLIMQQAVEQLDKLQ